MRPETQRLILDPSGIPRNGLAGMWIPALDFDGRNLLAWSADLTNALWVAADATKDAATLLTFTAQNGNVYQARTTTEGVTYTLSFKARAVSGNTALHVLHTNSATGNSTALTVNGTLTQYSVSVLGKTGSGAVNFGVQDQNAAGFGQIEITDFQVNLGSIAQPYNPTTAKQVLFDRSGGNFHGRLGATTGAEASDPRWDPDGLYYTTNDYVNLDASGSVYGPAYMVLAVVKGEPSIATEAFYSEGRAIAGNPYLFIGSGAAGTSKLRVSVRNDVASTLLAVESTAVVLDGGWHLVGLRDIEGAYTLFVDGAKDKGTYTRGTTTLSRGTLGALGTNTYTLFLTGSIGALIRWKREITNEEYERTRRELRRMLAPSGITLP